MQCLGWRAATALCVACLACACTVGPDYRRPDANVPTAFKEAAPEGWKPGQPQDLGSRGAWWAVYEDPVLDGLEQQVEVSNQTLKASEAAYRQSVAAVQAARATFFPEVTLTAAATRASTTTSAGVVTQNDFNIGPSASWEPDLWGRIRRTVESDTAHAQASAADLAAARLSAQSQLAQYYFELRSADELKRLLEATMAAYQRTLEITRNRYAVGVAAKSDVVSAETQLENTHAAAVNVEAQRDSLEHAIAMLIGKTPLEFSIQPAPLSSTVPAIPYGVPSTLLERRPDIAAAERQTSAANAQIGVAISAWFPTLTLSASAGFNSPTLSRLLQASNRAWSVGPQLAETLFDAGARSAQVAGARATYDETVANYRQSVLVGIQQVEDDLAILRVLAHQAEVQNRAVELARQAEQLTLNSYKAGVVDYTTVVQAQATALSSEQSALTIRQSRLMASIALIAALGGGWSTAALPGKQELE